MIQPLLDELRKLGTTGVMIKDSSLSGAARDVERCCRVMWLMLTNDSRGMPACNLMSPSPARVGACSRCDQPGYHLAHRTVYLGSCRHLPLQHPLREEYRKQFRFHPLAKQYHNKRRPRAKTKERQRERGELVEASTLALSNPRHPWKQLGCHGVDAWTLTLGPECNWDSCLMNFFCIAHIVMNLVKDLFKMLGGVKKGAYSKGRQRHDAVSGKRRLLQMKKKEFVCKKKLRSHTPHTHTHARAHTHTRTHAHSAIQRTRTHTHTHTHTHMHMHTCRDVVDDVMSDPDMRMWQGADSAGRKLFKHLAFLKIHDCYLLLGARGILFFGSFLFCFCFCFVFVLFLFGFLFCFCFVFALFLLCFCFVCFLFGFCLSFI